VSVNSRWNPIAPHSLLYINPWEICSVIHVSEINYLCVHKKLRSKRLAPVLIKEVTRQCHLKGIFQAIYTAGIVIPTPITVCRYYHRLLNIPKLVNTQFCYVPRNMTLARMIRVNKVPAATTLPGLREMREKDIVAVTQLLNEYMKRFTMVPLFDIDEARHQFLSGMGKGEMGSGGPNRREQQVTFSYVVEVRVFAPFCILPLMVIFNSEPRHRKNHRFFLILFLAIHCYRQHYPSNSPSGVSILLCH